MRKEILNKLNRAKEKDKKGRQTFYLDLGLLEKFKKHCIKHKFSQNVVITVLLEDLLK